MKSLKVALFLATQSIARGNIGITILIISILILANLNLLFVPSLVNGIVQSANDKLVNTFASNIVIHAKGTSPLINRADELITRIAAMDGVTGVTYRNTISAEFVHEDDRANGTVRAVRPENERQVFTIPNSMVEGSYLDPRDLDQMVLGVQLAGNNRPKLELYSSSLKTIHAGDKITVTYTNGVRKEYTVKGIFYTEFIQTDAQAFITEREFKSINPLINDQAFVINVKTRSDADAPRIVNGIAQIRDGLTFETWEDTAGIVKSMTTSFTIINAILTVVNLLFVGFTVFIVTYIDLTHKRRQIGIERAIGITPLAITLSYVFRALFYAILAIVLAWLLYHYAIVPLELRYPFHFPFGNIALVASRELIIRSASTVLEVTVLAAFLPVLQTLKIKLLDAIWG